MSWVKFIQPGETSVILYRVTGGDPSGILGKLQANWQLFLPAAPARSAWATRGRLTARSS